MPLTSAACSSKTCSVVSSRVSVAATPLPVLTDGPPALLRTARSVASRRAHCCSCRWREVIDCFTRDVTSFLPSFMRVTHPTLPFRASTPCSATTAAISACVCAEPESAVSPEPAAGVPSMPAALAAPVSTPSSLLSAGVDDGAGAQDAGASGDREVVCVIADLPLGVVDRPRDVPLASDPPTGRSLFAPPLRTTSDALLIESRAIIARVLPSFTTS